MLSFSKLFSFLTIVGAVVGVFVVYLGATEANTVMQEMGAMLLALIFVIFPYCVSKVAKDLAEPEDVSRYYMPEPQGFDINRLNNVTTPEHVDRVQAQEVKAKPTFTKIAKDVLNQPVNSPQQRTPKYRMGKVEELPASPKPANVIY